MKLRAMMTCCVAAMAAFACQAVTHVDLLVAYDTTAQAWLAAEGIDATTLAGNQVAKANEVLVNSGLGEDFDFRLVGVYLGEFTHTPGNLASTLVNSAQSTGSEWSALHGKREEVGADIVVVLVNNGTAYTNKGQSYSLAPEVNGERKWGLDFPEAASFLEWFSEMAYGVVDIGSAVDGLTFVHEVGHVMGAGHSDLLAADPGPQLYDYSTAMMMRGSDGEYYSTVMGYNVTGYSGSPFYTVLPYFSSPSVKNPATGEALGDATHDNVRTLRNTYASVAGFRAQVVPSEDAPTPPANDSFANAQEIVGASGSVEGTSVNATREANELLDEGLTETVWYKWTAPADGDYFFRAIDTVGLEDSVCRIGVTTGYDAEAGEWRERRVADYAVAVRATAGVTYWISVYGRNWMTGELLDFELSWGAAPANDDYLGAVELESSDGGSIVGSIDGATSYVDRDFWYGPPTVWYRWEAPFAGFAEFSVAGDDNRYKIVVASGRDDEIPVSDWAYVYEDYIYLDERDQTVEFMADAGVTYYISILAIDGWSGDFTLSWSEVPFELNIYRETDEGSAVVRRIVGGYSGIMPEYLTFPKDVDAIGDAAFEGAENVTEIVVPGNIKDVRDYAFSDCAALRTVAFREGVERLGEGLFYGCGDGLEVTLPRSVFVVTGEDGAERFAPGLTFDSDYAVETFSGIEGELHIYAPRGTEGYIYDTDIVTSRDYQYYDNERGELAWETVECVTAVHVEYYTHVFLDTNGGVLEDGDYDEYLSPGDTLEYLPVPVREGFNLAAWVDDEGNVYEVGYKFPAGVYELHLTAQWEEASESGSDVVSVDVNTDATDGTGGFVMPDNVKLKVGEAIGETNYVNLTNAIVAMVSTRHGLRLAGLVSGTKTVDASTIVEEGMTISAQWETFNPLYEGDDGAVDSTSAQVYDGYILDGAGRTVGSILVKVGKPNKNTDLAAITATVQMIGSSKKLTFKAKEKISKDAATIGLTLASTTPGTPILTLDIATDGLGGWYGANYEIIGARNFSKSKDKTLAAVYSSWVRTVNVAFATKAGTASGRGAAFAEGLSAVSVAIGAKGKVKITGTMGDGTKVNSSAQLLIADSGEEACVNAVIPLYSKKGGFGFVLWLAKDGTATVESIATWDASPSKTPFTAELESVASAAAGIRDGATLAFSLGNAPATIASATVVTTATDGTSLLPIGAKVAVAGGKFSLPKAGKVKADKTGAIVVTGDNAAGLKLTYTAKTGTIKGSFSFYTMSGTKFKKVKATLTGVAVDGKCYGTAVVKQVGSFGFELK